MNCKLKSTAILLASLFWGCSVTDEVARLPKNNFYVGVGLAHGGIIENTNMEVTGTTPPDSYSGATKVGISATGSYERMVRNHAIEVTAMAMVNGQEFTYTDAIHGFNGKRNLVTTQLRFPITYNITLFRNSAYQPLVQLKVGMAPGFSVINVIDNVQGLPAYSINSFSNGAVFGFRVVPMVLKNQARLGFGIDMFRGGQIYNDFYQQGDMPGSSYANFSVVYQFR
jgi:hypothetical protein